MTRRLKVYGWTGWEADCPPKANGSRQTRSVVAATSKKAAAALADVSPRDIVETGNADEIVAAMKIPGAVCWRPLDSLIPWKFFRKAVR